MKWFDQAHLARRDGGFSFVVVTFRPVRALRGVSGIVRLRRGGFLRLPLISLGAGGGSVLPSLKVCKEHLNLFPFATCFVEGVRIREITRSLSRLFIEVAHKRALCGGRTGITDRTIAAMVHLGLVPFHPRLAIDRAQRQIMTLGPVSGTSTKSGATISSKTTMRP